jgi:predicted helicase
MSRQSCTQYIAEVEKIIQYGGSRNEQTIRYAFQKLLGEYCEAKHLMLLAELDHTTPKGKTVRPDGTVKDQLRMTWGWWESKDEADDLDEEIAKKKAKGYPTENIVFEDSQTAVLVQNGVELSRVSMKDPVALDGLLTAFLNYVRPEVAGFRQAVETFKNDIPAITGALRGLIDEGVQANDHFRMARKSFLELLRDSVNPDVTAFDVDEMLIQHLLTEEIFTTVFEDALFHRYNIMAHRIEEILALLLTLEKRRALLDRIQPYYKVIKASAAQIGDIHEKQKFLKVIYENFYQAYNPKGADRLGVVYTPNEIVTFMLEATDHLLHRHFGKLLADEGVDILDPCTGTGTFLTALVDRLPAEALKRKYPTELHANEVAILPYYIANLNIEYTYKQKVGTYEAFPGICFVDTLDNNAFSFAGKQGELTMGVGAENIERIKRQNERKISVVIGNPPYNANQQNENDNNKNRAYPTVDKRIKDTYVARSDRHKTKQYDPYKRFLRWASDRIDKNGVVAFVTNRSYIDDANSDGYRKVLREEFDEIYVVDLGGDVRSNPKLSGTTHNVFGIQTGVAISFLVRKEQYGKDVMNPSPRDGKLFYYARPEFERASDKLSFLHECSISSLPFVHILPDQRGNWLNITTNDWSELLPLALPKLSGAKTSRDTDALFDLASFGAVSARDDWVYGADADSVRSKMSYYFSVYESRRAQLTRPLNDDWETRLGTEIKWSQDIRRHLKNNQKLVYEESRIVPSLYRPFTIKPFYYSKWANWSLYRLPEAFPTSRKVENRAIVFLSGDRQPFACIATTQPPNLNMFTADTAQCLPLSLFSESGERRDNITDWALKLFQDKHGPQVTKLDIFHYVYGVLHHPAYRAKYEVNLKRDLPRIPLYPDFGRWKTAGEALMALHLGFETLEPFPLTLADGRKTPEGSLFDPKVGSKDHKIKIKVDKDAGKILFDTPTGLVALSDIPTAAWEYKLGHRSAVEWVLDQHADYTPKDPTVAAKFHTYRLADHLDEVIALVGKVTRVSVETMKIVGGLVP